MTGPLPADFWDRIADRYAKRPIDDPDAYQAALERTRSHLRPQDDVLELGCGTGSTALLLAPEVGRYTASDLSPRMIEIGGEKAAAEGVGNLEFIAADLSNPQLSDRPRDAVLALNLLHLLEDLPEALSRVHAMLRPGGLFISKTVCPISGRVPIKLRLMLWALPVMQWLGKAPYVNFMSTDELETAITQAGFEIIETGNYPASPPSRYVVARRL
ncbi:Ubiquinone/menaquinone biosynthesis C-methylase UbiE [Cribrihabitans marinus]|uniref:Ubiquinone/menaquinone biosynthesis C-methylase UbiE n=1 Tax=Cribrihabitans marinus TaxID=1227549 RepID=A0A1H6TD66_9RHOB|nr:class I SAM-dependent methyltransferase [Cribrihabitans marinus]GGH21949.1 hypothetical protein GCM10010973_06880 [Cribrihabitans marinus]SEI78053.1 Ubiquinone/menaquinone biosynthesis C-methylase UbiE [Cribrihabitans marinus]